jgi:molecular chaperone DnaK
VTPRPSDPSRPVLGIDLGTTYTCVATVGDGAGEIVLPNSEGETITPSVVYFDENGMALVGRMAVAYHDHEPGRVVSLIKREMGRANVTVDAGGRRYHPQQVSAVILLKVVQDALAHLGRPLPESGPVADAIVTVPAYFGAAERKATAQAAQLARLNLLDIVDEPVAAAVAHGLCRGEARTMMVYDLGGGTFDVTVIQTRPDAPAQVVAIDGGHRLGGADWDQRLTELVLSRISSTVDSPRGDPKLMGRLARQLEQVKIALSESDRHTVDIESTGGRVESVTVTRDEYEDATADLLDRTLNRTRDALEKAREHGVVVIDDLLLAGGMSRTPAVARCLREELPELPPARLARDADHIVAKGAARLAWRTAGGARVDDEVRTVTAKGYGVAVVRNSERPDLGNGLVWMIKPGANLPVTHGEQLCTIKDNQRQMSIQVYESATGFVRDGLADNPADHNSVVKGEVVGLPARLPKGQPVDVNFELGADGILHVHARAVNGADLWLEARVAGAMSPEDMKAPLPGLRLRPASDPPGGPGAGPDA